MMGLSVRWFSRGLAIGGPSSVGLALLLLSACASSDKHSYPSLLPRPAEQDRVIAAADEPVAGLSPEEQASIADELQRVERAFASTRTSVRAAEAELAAALKAGGNAAIGSDLWSRAQMALSRLDDARAPLAQHDAALTPLLLQVDGLPSDDGNRQAVTALTTTIADERARVDAVAGAAEQRLAHR